MHIFITMQEPTDVLFYQQPITELELVGQTVSVWIDSDNLTSDLLRTYGIEHTTVPADGRRSRAERFQTTLADQLQEAEPDVVTGIYSPMLSEVTTTVDATPVLFRDGREISQKGARCDFSGETVPYVLPNRFRPDNDGLDPLDQDTDKPYFLVDGETGNDDETQSEVGSTRDILSSRLTEYGTVYLNTTEGITTLDGRPVPVTESRLHDFLEGADLYVGNSARMARETGLLATPTIWTGHETDDCDRTVATLWSYGLVEICQDCDSILRRAEQLVPNPTATAVWNQRHRAFLSEQYHERACVLDAIGVSTSKTALDTSSRSTMTNPQRSS